MDSNNKEFISKYEYIVAHKFFSMRNKVFWSLDQIISLSMFRKLRLDIYTVFKEHRLFFFKDNNNSIFKRGMGLVYVSASAWGSQKIPLHFLEMASWMTVSLLIWIMGSELRFSRRAVHVRKQWAIPSAPITVNISIPERSIPILSLLCSLLFTSNSWTLPGS